MKRRHGNVPQKNLIYMIEQIENLQTVQNGLAVRNISTSFLFSVERYPKFPRYPGNSTQCQRSPKGGNRSWGLPWPLGCAHLARGVTQPPDPWGSPRLNNSRPYKIYMVRRRKKKPFNTKLVDRSREATDFKYLHETEWFHTHV